MILICTQILSKVKYNHLKLIAYLKMCGKSSNRHPRVDKKLSNVILLINMSGKHISTNSLCNNF